MNKVGFLAHLARLCQQIHTQPRGLDQQTRLERAEEEAQRNRTSCWCGKCLPAKPSLIKHRHQFFISGLSLPLMLVWKFHFQLLSAAVCWNWTVFTSPLFDCFTVHHSTSTEEELAPSPSNGEISGSIGDYVPERCSPTSPTSPAVALPSQAQWRSLVTAALILLLCAGPVFPQHCGISGVPGIPGTHGQHGKDGMKGEEGDPGEPIINHELTCCYLNYIQYISKYIEINVIYVFIYMCIYVSYMYVFISIYTVHTYVYIHTHTLYTLKMDRK